MSEADPDLAALAHRPAASTCVTPRGSMPSDRGSCTSASGSSGFAARMPENAVVLDLGCGAGEPIAGWLVQSGFRVIGIDAAAPMLEIARRRYPDGDWRQADMRSLDLPERFHGIIGWNSFFHLRPDEQRATLRRLAAHLLPRGALMLTVGPQAGEVTGTVAGEPVYHSSLRPRSTSRILAALGLTSFASSRRTRTATGTPSCWRRCAGLIGTSGRSRCRTIP